MSVQPQPGAAALTAYALPPGTCPPGTAVAQTSRAVHAVLDGARTAAATTDGTVSGTVLLSRSSNLLAVAAQSPELVALTLSARQQDDRELYAAMVEHSTKNVTLCALAAEVCVFGGGRSMERLMEWMRLPGGSGGLDQPLVGEADEVPHASGPPHLPALPPLQPSPPGLPARRATSSGSGRMPAESG